MFSSEKAVKLSIQKAQFLLLVGSTSRALKRP
jgi:hypothetical protein